MHALFRHFFSFVLFLMPFANETLATEPLVDWSKTKLYLRPSFVTVPANSELVSIEELNLLPLSLEIAKKNSPFSFRFMPLLGISDFDETGDQWGMGFRDFIRPNMQHFPIKTLGFELATLLPILPSSSTFFDGWYYGANYAFGYHREYIYRTHKVSFEVGKMVDKRTKRNGYAIELGCRFRDVNANRAQSYFNTIYPIIMPKFFIGF